MNTNDILEPPPQTASTDGETPKVYIVLQTAPGAHSALVNPFIFVPASATALRALHYAIIGDLDSKEIAVLDSNCIGLIEDCLLTLTVNAPPYAALKAIRETLAALHIAEKFTVHYLMPGEQCFRRYRVAAGEAAAEPLTLAAMLANADRIISGLRLAAAKVDRAAQALKHLTNLLKSGSPTPPPDSAS